eukprot:TRINITY_DN5705_c0_g1_i2.p1 TRINITY_DN5705_c0_g1~~TRINITY_DN5705_c0_g1_i2.p1  ORF type:complete len:607 (-),score=38.67 TRINITY_DN5705_c0_g1_i2:440-2128(-)
MACQFVIRRWLKSLINDTKGQCRFYSKYPIDSTADVIVIGGGHNGLVASIILARQGLNVKVIEERKHVGGACITEQPFTKVPTLKASTGAYLLGLMPPELVKILGIKIPTVKRDPYYFLPTTGDKYLLFGSNQQAMEQQFLKWFHEDDWKAHKRMQSELASFREDLGVSWLMPPFSLEETAERFIRKHLRNKFIDLCTQPVMHYLDRFGFKNDLLKAMYAVTDGISGLSASINDSGTGMNFLTHNMCRLPDADGTWQLVRGGMGTLTDLLAIQAFQEGVQIHRGVKVLSIEEKGGLVESVVVSPDARTAEEIWHGVIPTKAVLVNADPFTLRDMVGSNILGDEIQNILRQREKDGMTFKLNMALKGLPKFKCLIEDHGQLNGTIHLLPQSERDVLGQIHKAYEQASQGFLPDFPTIEWYIHSTLDPSLQDSQLHHSSALFVQWVPNKFADESSWDEKEIRFSQHLLSICDQFAPGTSDLVVDIFPLSPDSIQSHFGIHKGHIHHFDNSFAFDQRFPHRVGIEGLYCCSAGTHPAGSVIGAAGYNAAMCLLEDIGRTGLTKGY